MTLHTSPLHLITTILLLGIFIIPSAQADEPKDDITLVKKICTLILQKSLATEEVQMKDYSSIIPKAKVPYDMIAIKGGTFLMGSPADEKDRNEDEGPQRKVEVKPF